MNIMVLVNKSFEYPGYRAGVESRITSGKLKDYSVLARDTSVGPQKQGPTCVYQVAGHIIREFCINYLFPADEDPAKPSVSSNSEKKLELLKTLIEKEKPDYIISVSTGESTPFDQDKYSDNNSVNGCVFIGTRFFACDCSEDDPDTESHLDIAKCKWTPESKPICEKFYSLLEKADLSEGMIKVPNSPGSPLDIYAGDIFTSLGVINVMNYKCYSKADQRTYLEFTKNNWVYIPVSLETTHAVVKMAAGEIPVLFVSPIVDRYESFSTDVEDSWGNQNLFSSYNAGVAVTNMLSYIAPYLKE